MYPVLILRCETVCLIILVFLFFVSRSYKIDSESRTFGRILCFALIHVAFDIITVLTVNNADVVPAWINRSCHIVFYISAILFSNEIVNYVVAICYPAKAKNAYAVGHMLMLLYLCSLSCLKIEYVEDVGTYSSAGAAAYVGYGLAFVFFIIALVLIFTHMDKMSNQIKSTLIPMMLVLIITEFCQVIWRSVLFTGGAITIVTVGFFFSLENPAEVFRKKAMTDALTGVQSRNSYEEDIERCDREFRDRPGGEYIFVLCDLNDLRKVNNRFGHAEGDNYISLIASALSRCMKHSTAVYRIGGDEFLILYYKVDTETVEKEIEALQSSCEKASETLSYTAAVAAGYAASSPEYRSLRDVVKTADYAMYQNKARMKKGAAYDRSMLGSRLNYAGLTDKMFNAICASSDRSYPFITNLDTNVTRISPGWKEYFGLEEEFYADFNSVWKERIHPDYYEGFLEDIAAVVNGHKKYHNYDYLAKKADGEYVRVACHGSVYRDSGSSYFTGFMVNYGMESNTDPITGLKNFDALTSRVCAYMDESRPFSVIKLKLNNFARVNMLYGYDGGTEVIRRIADILTGEIPETGGEVFCQDSVNFSVLFETVDEKILKEYYRRVSGICEGGVETDTGVVPVLLSGGALTNTGRRREITQMRSGLVFALEESHYYRRNGLVFYRLFDNAAGSDVSLLASIHADAVGGLDYFRLRYQPIVDLASGRTVAAEALLRWIHPLYGEVLPGRFIAFLENDPCYYRLGLGILEQAVKDAKKLQERIPGFRININITALQLRNESFADNVFEILDKYDFAPGSLVLELTERCKELDGRFLAERIAMLRSRGILVAFDDLGTGYSTISLLMNIPVDEIKLDRDFVKDLGKRENYRFFVKALVQASSAGENSYNICFEGVEDKEMLEQVSGFGSFLAQGYYFSKPLLIKDFNSYLDSES